MALPVAVAARKMGALFDTLLRAELAARFMIRARLLVVARYLVGFTVLRLQPRRVGACSGATWCSVDGRLGAMPATSAAGVPAPVKRRMI